MVILSEDCNKVAYLTYKNWIYVENITNLTNPNALFEQELPATYIAFIGIDRLLVNTTDNGINIINLPTNITDSADNIFSLLADEVQE
jgi:hypothetical protein